MRHVFYGHTLIIFQMHSSILDVLRGVCVCMFFPIEVLIRKILTGKTWEACEVGFVLSQRTLLKGAATWKWEITWIC